MSTQTAGNESEKILKVGITGGIGSGKSTVCHLFKLLGIPVYDADARAKFLMQNDPLIREKITDLFGEKAWLPDGSLDRTYLAGIVFQDAQKLKALEAIIHPAVLADGEKWHSTWKNVPYTLKEAALLFESGNNRYLDYTIVVSAPEELRIRRVMHRDGLAREAILSRMLRQWPEQEKIKLADFVIINDNSDSLVNQVWQIHQHLITLR